MGGYYFPMFVDISTKRILVIGGGKIAARRVRTLLKFAEHIEVTAPEICDEMKDILNGADIVLTAADDRELNQKIVSACRMRKILVNTADDKSLCDFFFPAVTEKDGVVIGMNSGGKSPKTVRKVREYLEKYR